MLNKGNDVIKLQALCDEKYAMSPSLNLAMEGVINPTQISVSDS